MTSRDREKPETRSLLDHALHVGASGRGEVSGKASEQRRR
jgi:hypothetical protein